MLAITGQLFLKFHGQRRALVEKKSQSLIVECAIKNCSMLREKVEKIKEVV